MSWKPLGRRGYSGAGGGYPKKDRRPRGNATPRTRTVNSVKRGQMLQLGRGIIPADRNRPAAIHRDSGRKPSRNQSFRYIGFSKTEGM